MNTLFFTQNKPIKNIKRKSCKIHTSYRTCNYSNNLTYNSLNCSWQIPNYNFENFNQRLPVIMESANNIPLQQCTDKQTSAITFNYTDKIPTLTGIYFDGSSLNKLEVDIPASNLVLEMYIYVKYSDNTTSNQNLGWVSVSKNASGTMLHTWSILQKLYKFNYPISLWKNESTYITEIEIQLIAIINLV